MTDSPQNMPDALVVLCSPRCGGVSDTVAHHFTQGVVAAGATVRHAALRDYVFSHCTGCMRCAAPPHHCSLSDRSQETPDQADELFTLFAIAPLALFAAPIYFYALPARFKAFIDRGQRFWAAKNQRRRTYAGQPPKPVLTALVAGRKRGKRLFAGAVLTLKYFLEPLDAQLRGARFLRGVEQPDDLSPAVCADLCDWGHRWGKKLTSTYQAAP